MPRPDDESPEPGAAAAPRGFTLRRTLQGHDEQINRIAWSPDGRHIVSPSYDKSVRVWDANTGAIVWSWTAGSPCLCAGWSADGRYLAVGTLEAGIRLFHPDGSLAVEFGLETNVWSLAWAPGGARLILGCGDGVRTWSEGTRQFARVEHSTRMNGIFARVLAVAWAPDGAWFAAAGTDPWIRVFDASDRPIAALERHKNEVVALAWSPDGKTLVSGSTDATIIVWDVGSRHATHVLEHHADALTSVAFSADGRFLASKSIDGTIRLWSCDRWSVAAILQEPIKDYWPPSLAFHPRDPTLLATLGEGDRIIRVWQLDPAALAAAPARRATSYASARVVLVGDQGAGKTCVARALTGEPFAPQESTHGMQIWKSQLSPADSPVRREVILWDLAGQSDYRIIHQLFLDEAVLGLVLFDASDGGEPFRGVKHWERALRRSAPGCAQLLVAGKVDRGRPAASSQTIAEFCQANGFAWFVATSAKTQEGVAALRAAIDEHIQWDRLPTISTTDRLHHLREYVLQRRANGEALMMRAHLRSGLRGVDAGATAAEIDAALAHAQAEGLIWPLSFCDVVLLQPALLNVYAAAVVRAIRREGDGLGCIAERRVLGAAFDFEDMPRLPDRREEQMLLHAVVELLIAREIALRERDMLVLPAMFSRTRVDPGTAGDHEVSYHFAGPIDHIYATLVVGLVYCRAFTLLADRYRDGIEFGGSGGRCEISLHGHGDGGGEIRIHFVSMSIEGRGLFLRFVEEHLYARAVAGTVRCERRYRCPQCAAWAADMAAIRWRLEHGKATVRCQYCDHEIPLLDTLKASLQRPGTATAVQALQREVIARRDEEVSLTTARAKRDHGIFDVFASFGVSDGDEVRSVAACLERRGISPCLDARPGQPVPRAPEQVAGNIEVVAVFVGAGGLGQGEDHERVATIQGFVARGAVVIPVLLPGVQASDVPAMLRPFVGVKFAATSDDPCALDLLEWGITGKHPLDARAAGPDADRQPRPGTQEALAAVPPAGRSDAQRAMGQLLVDCFDNEEFRKFVTRVDPGLAGHLQEGSVARVSLVETAIELLRRRGCVDARLFELWIEERPRRAPQISALARRLGLDIDAATSPPHGAA